jgi:hypothetical protein
MATAYPDLFGSAESAKKALEREYTSNSSKLRGDPSQTPIEKYLIGVCPRFLAMSFRKKGFSGPTSKLLFDPNLIEPLAWLTEKIGRVTVIGKPRKPWQSAARQR